MGTLIGEHLLDFFRREITAGRLTEPLPPMELGIGGLAANVMRTIGASEFSNFRFYCPVISDPVLEIAEAGKVDWMFAGGVLIGFGTRLAGGCTSGHGIFGLSNFEMPSLVSTLSFMAGGIVTTNLIYRVLV
jgi:uncharacterized membrane protein YedE/YeeE